MGTRPQVVLLMGPTAAGKTDLSLQLADRFNMEIVSVDSALVYRDMNIGTAKPEQKILDQYPHHLIDIRSPADSYSAAEFVRDADQSIRDILSRGKTPILAGGTMLYFRAITQGLSELPKADDAIREKLAQEGEQLGWSSMHEQLKKIDPASAERIHPNDPQRIQRALEIYQVTGQSMTEWIAKNKPTPLPYEFIKLAISPQDRAILHQRIEKRFDLMLEQGLVEEVIDLREKYILNLDRPSMRSVGYRQIWQHIDGDYDLDEARLKGIYATRQLAKRQLTWLRADSGINWFDPEKNNEKSSNPARFLREILNES